MNIDDADFPKWLEAGRYVLEGPITHGQDAHVFRARDVQKGRVVALKLFRAPGIDQNDLGERFLAEARLMSELRHPHMVQVFAYGQEQDVYWYAMELLPGGNTYQYVEENGPLTPEQAATWIGQVLDALTVLHRTKAVHRDVNPANILLDRSGNAKLADFGMARHAEGSVGFHTEMGLGVGTVEWGSPEQLANAHQVTPAADVYGVGCTLGYLLTGLRPTKLSIALAENDEVIRKLDPELVHILVRATAWTPEERYADAEAMAVVLRPWRVRGMGERIRSWFRW